MIALPIEEIVATPPRLEGLDPIALGASREGRPLLGYRFGEGPEAISLIAGCHADEPVGPAMLERLVAWLAGAGRGHPLLERARLFIVPHTNPDGEKRNAGWTEHLLPLDEGESGYELLRYLRLQHREPPGEDIEFGFPRHPEDHGARVENRAIAAFLRPGAPFSLHATFHGMAFAAGPWFLIERSWADRTVAMRQHLRQRVRAMGYRVHDIDRRGEKGFHRIDEGFTSRPDSGAMIRHFETRGDLATAALFRPSSMEFVRSLGGDPLTLVSEMPLFLLPREHFQGPDPIRPQAVGDLLDLARSDVDGLAKKVEQVGLKAMPVADQMRLQLAFLDTGLAAALDAAWREGLNRPGTRDDP